MTTSDHNYIRSEIEEQLRTQLDYVRGKLNYQKEEIKQLEAARDYWKGKYLNGGTGIALAVLHREAFIDHVDYSNRIEHQVLAAACLQLHEVLKPGGKYNLRISEETRREIDAYLPGTRYKITIHVWEEGAHGTADTNEGK